MVYLISRVMRAELCTGFIVEDATGYRFFINSSDIGNYAVANMSSSDMLPVVKEI